jgi:hypothetical protein
MSANVEIVPPAGELCRARAVHVERRAGRYSDSNMQRAEEREGKGRGRAIADWQDGIVERDSTSHRMGVLLQDAYDEL